MLLEDCGEYEYWVCIECKQIDDKEAERDERIFRHQEKQQRKQ